MKIFQVKKSVLNLRPEWRISSICFLGEGDFCAAYLINDEWIFRFAKHVEARESLRREVCLLPQLAAHLSLPIPVPEISDFQKKKKSFIAYRLLNGRALEPEIYAGLVDEYKTSVAVQTADFLNQLHSSDLAAAENCGVPKNDYIGQYSHLKTQARKYLFPVMSKTEAAFVERTIENYLDAGENFEFRPSLLHGDFSHDHILFDEKTKKICGVIDFGDMMIGDPAWDFLWLYENYGADFVGRILKSYNGDDKSALVVRVLQFSYLQAIEWAADCGENNSVYFTSAVSDLRKRIVDETQSTDIIERLKAIFR